MSKKEEIFISKETFSKMMNKRIGMGFSGEDWDKWFEYILNNHLNQELKKSVLEKKWEEVYYQKFYDEWIRNFALNLPKIWEEFSARALDPARDPNYNVHENSAIVIGRGPSIKKHSHLKLIADSKYNGSIVCTDGALTDTLRAGITPEKFPKFFVVTIDSREEIKNYYNDPSVDEYGSKIKGIFSTIVNPETVDRARHAGIQVHWLHALFDFNEGKKSFNQISALMVRAKNHTNGLPAIQTGGNVGTSSWFVSWKILKCTTVALIGINHGWNEDDPWEIIVTHGYTHSPIKVDKNDPVFEKLFPRVYNPEFNCYCILDPIFQYYSSALREFIARSPQWITTINATEGGCIFGERIKCTTLANFLSTYEK